MLVSVVTSCPIIKSFLIDKVFESERERKSEFLLLVPNR